MPPGLLDFFPVYIINLIACFKVNELCLPLLFCKFSYHVENYIGGHTGCPENYTYWLALIFYQLY